MLVKPILFVFRMKIFFDEHNRLEYSFKNNEIEYEQALFAQFFVEYSTKLNELYKMHDQLKYLHLTLLQCWLTTGSDQHMNVHQVLIENGYLLVN